MTSLDRLLGAPFTAALGWTLLHFVWQGTMIAALLGAALRGMTRASVQARYAIACGAMGLMVLCPAATLALVWPHSFGTAGTGASSVTSLGSPRATQNLPAGRAERAASSSGSLIAANLSRALRRGAERVLPDAVVLWGTGVLLLAVRLVGGWVGIQWVRKTAAPLEGAALRARLETLTRRMNIRRPVRLLQSEWVSGPAVVGVLRPVILIPAAAVTGLWPIQIEAILAHELAHIRRHDFFFNLLQSLVETILFYHPAVWWVSGRIRDAREHCCDDLAAALCGDRRFYAAALADLDVVRGPALRLAMAADGTALLPRIRRLLTASAQESGGETAWMGAGLSGALIIALLCFNGSSGRAPTAKFDLPPAAQGAPISSKLLPARPEHRPALLAASRAATPTSYSAPVVQTRPAPSVDLPQPQHPIAPAVSVPEETAANEQSTAPAPSKVSAAPTDASLVLPIAFIQAPHDLPVPIDHLRAVRDPRHPNDPDKAMIALHVPTSIAERVRRETGMWPLGGLSVRIVGATDHHIDLSGRTAHVTVVNGMVSGWEVSTRELSAEPTDRGTRIRGEVDLTIYPGTSYAMRFEADVAMRWNGPEGDVPIRADVAWLPITSSALSAATGQLLPTASFDRDENVMQRRAAVRAPDLGAMPIPNADLGDRTRVILNARSARTAPSVPDPMATPWSSKKHGK